MAARAHPKIRYLRELRRDRALRDADGVFVAEGVHLAQEALDASASIRLAVLSPRLSRTPEGAELRRRLERGKAELLEVSDDTLDGIQDARSAQPILLLIERRSLTVEDVVPGRSGVPLVVVAHGIQDPGTLGAMIRSADAAGATGFAVTGDGADLHHPRTVRATMGSIFRLPAAALPFDRVLQRSREQGLALLATAAREGSSYHDSDLSRPLAILFGSEGAGLPADLAGLVEESVRVPMRAGVESLSVAAAAAVILFETARQRSGSAPRG